MNDLELELERLGDRLQLAARLDLERPRTIGRRRWRIVVRRRAVVLAAAALVLLTAAGVGIGGSLLKTPKQEEQGLLDASATFAGTLPACTEVAARSFHCTLATKPTGLVVVGSYRGAKMPSVDSNRRVDGGCVATSDDGREWQCFLGDLAVKQGIVDADVLGQTIAEPAHG